MYTLAIVIALLSNTIFLLGILNQLYFPTIAFTTIFYFLITIFLLRQQLTKLPTQLIHSLKDTTTPQRFLLSLFLLQALINIIGALGPEHAFDALWYHIPIPKIYLAEHSVFFIKGGLLYYSAMPKFTEMLYLVALAFSNEITAKLFHFLFGLLTTLALYKLSRQFLNKTYSLLAIVIFYANLVVAWQSITAYIELSWAFYEILALSALITFMRSKQKKWLITAAMLIGCTFSIKLLALGSLTIYLSLLFLYDKNQTFPRSQTLKNILLFTIISLLIALPHYLFAFINTGNPLYPIFSDLNVGSPSLQILNPINFIIELYSLLLFSPDPLNPIYLIILPLLLITPFTQNLLNHSPAGKSTFKLLTIYSAISILIWYFIPRSGGGRFVVPYLPAYSLLSTYIISQLQLSLLKKFLISLTIFITIISIGYRALANKKYLPVLLGKTTKTEFLTQNLRFHEDFYDIDGHFEKNIKPTDKVLIYDIHNLIYVDFPFIHQSWRTPQDQFNYLLIRQEELPAEFKNWEKVYENQTANIRLYRKP